MVWQLLVFEKFVTVKTLPILRLIFSTGRPASAVMQSRAGLSENGMLDIIWPLKMRVLPH